MNANDIIQEVQQNASEWIEMSENPAALVAGILAGKVIELMNHITYLERRLSHDSGNTNNGHRARNARVATAQEEKDYGN